MIAVSKPALAYEGSPGPAALERPLTVLVAPVISSGRPLAPDAVATSGFFVYRRTQPGAAPELWDTGAKLWTADPGPALAGRAPTAFAYMQGDAHPWQGILVGAGGKDATGAPQFVKATNGYPLYHVRAWFTSKDGAQNGLSEPSENVGFASVSDKNLVALGAPEDQRPDQATEAHLVLKNTALQTIGRLAIDRDFRGATVTIDNAAGASIVLLPDGSIEVTSAAGRGIVLAGDLETERITYRPGGGGPKRLLP
jgi:hypothetical protein